MSKVKLLLMVLINVGLTACASNNTETTEIPLENDPRIGESVHHICYTGITDGWGEVDNDPDAIILTRGLRDQYKLKLIGACDPDWAMFKVAFVQRMGRDCISQGDRVYTDSTSAMGYCTIMRINKWHPENIESESEEPTTPENQSQ